MMENYLSSTVGIVINVIGLLIFIPFSLKKLSIIRKGASGEFSVNGVITWSEYGRWSNVDMESNGCLISYSYSVGDQNFNNTIPRKYFVRAESLVKKYPRGKAVKVYYSPSNPEYSWVDKRPNQLRTLLITAKGYLIAPLLSINLCAYLIYIFNNAS
ncbi:hypothetical protein GCM10007916_34990 [Psychromonas marina]|uniref:DUF3592 domain-containing protein n=1 Tax=Psychromonas marina TaxID=88364 RepID=A0ABQ6E5F5_9GAMM|nr:DUF3592 domain-containing protein [Psychromonas marina]GLS92428.1 hypothetical protein GCM10007916_34990 [Psychromonas marina]